MLKIDINELGDFTRIASNFFHDEHDYPEQFKSDYYYIFISLEE